MLANYVRIPRTNETLCIIDVKKTWKDAGDSVLAYASSIKSCDPLDYHVVRCGKLYYALYYKPGKHTQAEIAKAIEKGYDPSKPYRAESVYINRSTRDMVDLKNLYHSMIDEFGTDAVMLVAREAKKSLFSRAYFDALMMEPADSKPYL